MSAKRRPKPHHFPQKGERLVDGVWVIPEPAVVKQGATAVEQQGSTAVVKQGATAVEQRNWYRAKAGWPALK